MQKGKRKKVIYTYIIYFLTKCSKKIPKKQAMPVVIAPFSNIANPVFHQGLPVIYPFIISLIFIFLFNLFLFFRIFFIFFLIIYQFNLTLNAPNVKSVTAKRTTAAIKISENFPI